MSRFQTTRWNLVSSAASDAPAKARPALDALCRAYRPPVLAYVRRTVYRKEDAEDLVQAFFLRFVERAWYANADPAKGRFRNLLLVSLRRFIADGQALQGARFHARTRDGPEALDRLAGGESPEQAFDRAWLGTVLARALERLRLEWEREGKDVQYAHLAPLLAEGTDRGELQAIAGELGITPNTLAVQLHRMRARLRQLARLEVLRTVSSPEALEDELAELRSVLAGDP